MLIGLDRVVGHAGAELRAAWIDRHGPIATVAQIDVRDLSLENTRTVVDVRDAHEWHEGHLPGAEHRFLGTLVESLRGVSRDEPLALYCHGGTRAAIAASLLRAEGFTDIATAPGGIVAWEAAGLPVERDSSSGGAARR
jgi:hydroxyacylglutathione hydrolase